MDSHLFSSRKDHEFFCSVLELLEPDLQIILQINPQLLVLSQSEMARQTLEHHTFYSLRDLFSRHSCQLMQQAMEQRVSQRFFDSLDGQPVEIRLVPLDDGALLSIRFCDEHHLGELVARQINKMDHCIRTRLNIILTALTAIKKQALPEDTKKYLSIVTQNSMRLLRNCTHLSLLYQPIEQWQTHFHAVNLVQSFDVLRKTTEQVIPHSLAQVAWEMPDEPVIAICDEEQLAIALFNLISNSIQHNEPGVQIKIQLSQSKNQIRLVVTDNGKGITPEQLSFSTQSLMSGQMVEEEMHTGLALINRIMANHFGSALFLSSTDGGAHVTLVFPADLPGDSSSLRSPDPFEVSPQWLADMEFSCFLQPEHYFQV